MTDSPPTSKRKPGGQPGISFTVTRPPLSRPSQNLPASFRRKIDRRSAIVPLSQSKGLGRVPVRVEGPGLAEAALPVPAASRVPAVLAQAVAQASRQLYPFFGQSTPKGHRPVGDRVGPAKNPKGIGTLVAEVRPRRGIFVSPFVFKKRNLSLAKHLVPVRELVPVRDTREACPISLEVPVKHHEVA